MAIKNLSLFGGGGGGGGKKGGGKKAPGFKTTVRGGRTKAFRPMFTPTGRVSKKK